MDSVGCGEDWLREDGNLWYARYPDGSFGGTDYPDLTYKDLVKLQELLRSLGHRSVPLLDRLIDSKGAWMEVNGVTVDPGED